MIDGSSLTHYKFDGSHLDVSRNYQNRVLSVRHKLIYSLIIIRSATCFNPVGLSSGLHCWDPKDVHSFLTLNDS